MLKCQKCGKTHEKFHLVCECGGLLDVIVEFKDSFESLLKEEYLDVRRYVNFLPINENFLPKLTLPITPTVEKEIWNVKVLFKLEYLMPSGSFKDRGTYVTIAKLKEEGIKEISIDSSGNAAISFALFGKAEGIKVHVFIPEHTSKGKKRILKLLGAEIHEIKGSRMDVHWKAREFKDAFYISHWYNPYFLEGTKIAAYEIFEQIGEIDYALVPTGSGTLFLGLYKGFKELNNFEKARMPKLIAAQAEGYESLCKRSKRKSKLAEGIAIPEPPRKEQMLKALKETKGFCISVGDSEIDKALNDLISMGFLVEPTSAVVFAAFKKLLERDELEKGSKVLLPLTGSGLKLM
ncbi:MAG: pyridoxal-phosphate dependent enzyme [Thermococcus sp.]|uniref:pyridoxal-phosphate dependent enzyme n=1 Tax=Thermococcus sp. TaxID=35749 RepID=UPI001DC8F90B|nr:pyridoxal-phosphate dependent enzyme [Thermococcus sp.]MBO8175806.1 pyridoxal-phosphate dependent enzyme [Thermococcus sp.]